MLDNPLDSLPEGTTALEWVISVKCLDEDAEVCLYSTRSDGLTAWEALGMATSAADDLREALRTCTQES